MKPYINLTPTADLDLKRVLDYDVLYSLKQKYTQQLIKTAKQNNDAHNIGTPSTIDTALSKRNSAIAISRRPNSRSSKKNSLNSSNFATATSLMTGKFQTVVTSCTSQQPDGKQDISKIGKTSVSFGSRRTALTDRAVYYGDVELPYLHSSDAISYLYQRAKSDKANPEPLINPPSSINASLLTSLKSLYLYYTSIDSLRQLGTGWSNLKSLTVMCSCELRDLSGLSIFPSLQYLFMAHNNISEISDIMYHGSLKCVDLEDNKIDSIEQIQYIYTIVNLQWVDIGGNPITRRKQKYRIICENLGNKLQIQDNHKLSQYQMKQHDLFYELLSYENMQVSNSLIKDINDQIMKEEIKVGQFWRAARSNIHPQPYEQSDIQIITSYQQYQKEFQSEEQYQQQEFQSQQNRNQCSGKTLQLRVTPLSQYIKGGISTSPLKKYFNNKVCPQLKPQSYQSTEKQMKLVQKQIKQHQKTQKQQLHEKRNKKFSATQTIKQSVSIDEKPRLNSVSLKKRLGKLSISKLSTLTPNIGLNASQPKHKDQYINDINPSAPGLKFLAKKRLLTKPSNELLSNN